MGGEQGWIARRLTLHTARISEVTSPLTGASDANFRSVYRKNTFLEFARRSSVCVAKFGRLFAIIAVVVTRHGQARARTATSQRKTAHRNTP